MIDYTLFDTETGKIKSFGTVQEEVFVSRRSESHNIIDGAYDDAVYYIVDDVPVKRPSFELSKVAVAADGIDSTIATGLPVPSVFDIDGEEYTVVDGVFEFSTTIPGRYLITMKTFPYTENTIEVVFT